MDDSTQKALDAMNELINSDGAVELPGLDLDTVAETFVQAKYGKDLDAVEDVEERKKLKEKWVDYYKNGEGRAGLEVEINNIKSNFGAATDQLKFVGEAAASSIASNVIPSVITVGTATSAPNPAYVLIENKTKKNQLLAMLKNISACLVNLLKSAIAIAFPIPAVVTTLISTLATVKSTVNAIPV